MKDFLSVQVLHQLYKAAGLALIDFADVIFERSYSTNTMPT